MISHFGIVSGKRDPRGFRAHVQSLRAAYQAAENAEDYTSIQQRIGKLTTGLATLWVGGMTGLEIEAHKEVAKRTVNVLRGAILQRVIPGEGVSLLTYHPHCSASGTYRRRGRRVVGLSGTAQGTGKPCS